MLGAAGPAAGQSMPDEIAETGGAGTALLADLYRTPFVVRRPNRQQGPFVLASPHAGRIYPDSFLAASLVGLPAIRRSEDAYADLLFADANAFVPFLSARFPRAYVDANRRESELDPSLFEEPPNLPMEYSPRVAAGFGVIPKIVREGVRIARYKLAALEAEERLFRLHRPYHRALKDLMTDTKARFGMAILIDCHTMPHTPGAADIVLGDRYGTSVPTKLIEFAEKRFAAEGFSVARNVPFAGGYCTSLYARPSEGFFALQIEVHRPLYLDEETVTPNDQFDQVRRRIGAAVKAVVAAPLGRVGLSRHLTLAAE